MIPANILELTILSQEKCQIGLAVLGWGPPFSWTVTQEDLFILGQKYERVILMENDEIRWVSTNFNKDNLGFSIDLKPEKNTYAECLSLYNQILSTFKFIE